MNSLSEIDNHYNCNYGGCFCYCHCPILLWPNIYPYTTWCESAISGKETRLSCKKSFSTKVFSEITDYALHYDLLQWQYDRAIYKVVSGAINTARFANCSPARALDTKPFSPTYWQWQHRFLLDAVQQFGLPDAFINIYKICKLRKAIFSTFYNISQPNFTILLNVGCSFKLW